MADTKQATPDIREFPEQEKRVETGPIQFSNDWPGIFIRGDDAFGMITTIRGALAGEKFGLVRLRGIAKLLCECNLNVELRARIESELASRSGPDRTTQEDGTLWSLLANVVQMFQQGSRWNKWEQGIWRGCTDYMKRMELTEAGPDRGRQDAPDWTLDTMVRDFCKVGPLPKSEVRRRIIAWAKAAREGQAQELSELKAKLQCMELRARSAEKIAGL